MPEMSCACALRRESYDRLEHSYLASPGFSPNFDSSTSAKPRALGELRIGAGVLFGAV